MLRCLIYLDLSFVQGDKYDKYGSIFTFLHTNCQLNQQYLLEMLSFSIVYFWLLCQRSMIHKCVKLFLCLQFYYIDPPACLCCHYSHYCSVVQLENKDGDSPRRSFIVKNCLYCPCFLFCFVFVFSRQGFSVQPLLSWNSLCRLVLPQTQKCAHLCLPSSIFL